jgi:prepilin-type N-terminal cleavage/methylation domain-containing protein
MMRNPLQRYREGFTLIEMVIVILLLGITSTAIISLNRGMFSNAGNMRELQTNVQLLQACAERVRTLRYLSGFNQTSTDYDTACEALPLVSANSNKFLVTNVSTTASSCPSGATCQLVEIKVNGTLGSIGPISLQFMQY